MDSLSTKRGDTWTLRFAWTEQDGSPIDVSGCTALLHVRDVDGVLAVEASTDDGTLTAASGGIVNMSIPASGMELVEPGTYKTDLQITFADGTVRSTETIKLRVAEDITRDA